ncbi:OsmC family protein [Nocardia brevicatena]|uniref:OsmC family protein n=1 Tax=Nocardia brevicatena TaxID=37327 RepID=UPI0005954D9E|nr:OsmC family protein [Nocardia brevicatena]
MTTHHYECSTEWTGARGNGTVDYRSYDREYVSRVLGRPDLVGSSDPAFRGDPTRWNPELLLVAALGQCHLLWYLHLCAVNGVTVLGYRDDARGTMTENGVGGGRFTNVELRPVVTVASGDMVDRARELHAEAAARCFIASSVNFPVTHAPTIEVAAVAP